MNNNLPIICFKCGQRPQDLLEYKIAIEDGSYATPEEFVEEQEGTYDRVSRTFLCTSCYIDEGMPLKKDIVYPERR